MSYTAKELNEYANQRFQEDDKYDWLRDVVDQYPSRECAEQCYYNEYVGSEEYKKDFDAWYKRNEDDIIADFVHEQMVAEQESAWECANER